MEYYAGKATDINYAALAYAVYGPSKKVTPDYAIAQVIRGPSHKKSARDAETLEMVRLVDQGYSYRVITQMMGFSNNSTVWWRVRRWRENHADQ